MVSGVFGLVGINQAYETCYARPPSPQRTSSAADMTPTHDESPARRPDTNSSQGDSRSRMTTVTRPAHLPAQPAARHQDQPLAVLEVPLSGGLPASPHPWLWRRPGRSHRPRSCRLVGLGGAGQGSTIAKLCLQAQLMRTGPTSRQAGQRTTTIGAFPVNPTGAALCLLPGRGRRASAARRLGACEGPSWLSQRWNAGDASGG